MLLLAISPIPHPFPRTSGTFPALLPSLTIARLFGCSSLAAQSHSHRRPGSGRAACQQPPGEVRDFPRLSTPLDVLLDQTCSVLAWLVSFPNHCWQTDLIGGSRRKVSVTVRLKARAVFAAPRKYHGFVQIDGKRNNPPRPLDRVVADSNVFGFGVPPPPTASRTMRCRPTAGPRFGCAIGLAQGQSSVVVLASRG